MPSVLIKIQYIHKLEGIVNKKMNLECCSVVLSICRLKEALLLLRKLTFDQLNDIGVCCQPNIVAINLK